VWEGWGVVGGGLGGLGLCTFLSCETGRGYTCRPWSSDCVNEWTVYLKQTRQSSEGEGMKKLRSGKKRRLTMDGFSQGTIMGSEFSLKQSPGDSPKGAKGIVKTSREQRGRHSRTDGTVGL